MNAAVTHSSRSLECRRSCVERGMPPLVWTTSRSLYQYWSPALNHWVHLDSCENARDEHLLYDVGWGKKQSYILAFSIEGAQDVSRAYIKDFDAALSRRTRMSEESLQAVLTEITRERRNGLSSDRLEALAREDEGQRQFLYGIKQGDVHLPARQTGTAEWIAARGEDGNNQP